MIYVVGLGGGGHKLCPLPTKFPTPCSLSLRDRRKELVKVAHTYAEKARVAARNVRRDGMDLLKQLEKAHLISEDDHKKKADDVQKMTDETIKDIEQVLKHKEQEIMQV